jgi:arylsulfatase A-like enzyme
MVLTHTLFVNTPDKTADNKLGKHKAMVRYTDKLIGQISRTLDNAKIRDNTVIIFTTDNGTSGSIKGMYKNKMIKGRKTMTTENGICEPFIISWTGEIKGNYTSNALIDFTYILPTCLDLAVGKPKSKIIFLDKSYVIDGRLFEKVLAKNNKRSDRKWILGMGGQNRAKLTENGVENKYEYRNRVLRNEKYKFFIGTNGVPEKFYDLIAHPYEEKNIIGNLNTSERKNNFKQFIEIIKSFPKKDNDPRYKNNVKQEWDVKVSAKIQEWKTSKN